MLLNGGARKCFMADVIHNFLEAKGKNFIEVDTYAFVAQRIRKGKMAHFTF